MAVACRAPYLQVMHLSNLGQSMYNILWKHNGCLQAHLVASSTQLLKGQHTRDEGLVIEEGVCMQSDIDQLPPSTTIIM